MAVPQSGKASVEGSTLGDNALALFAGSTIKLHSRYGPRTAWVDAGTYRATLVINHPGVITPVIRLIG